MKDISGRMYDLDWIKVFATFVVFLYHCSMFFNPFPWHIKNNSIDDGFILAFSLLSISWIMPIFFLISGISVFHALKRRSKKQFTKERFIRLGIPILFGALLLSPHQVYIERLTNNQFTGTILSFLPHYFDGLYLGIGESGNFAFMGLHLWYLLALLLFSLICLPIFSKIKETSLSSKGLSLIIHFIIPIVLFMTTMIETINLGGWDLLYYFVIFLFGYLIFSNPMSKSIIRKSGSWYIFSTIVSSIGLLVMFYQGYAFGSEWSMAFTAIQIINCWSWINSIFYIGDKYLQHRNTFLSYTSEAAMPFYVLHQPVIVLIGYFMYELSWSIPAKAILLVFLSFIIIIGVYHFIVRKMNLLRIACGLKMQKPSIKTVTSSTLSTK